MPMPVSVSEFEPTVKLTDVDVPGLDTKVGKSQRLILNYKVIEKTRSFTVLKITSAYLYPSKRLL